MASVLPMEDEEVEYEDEEEYNLIHPDSPRQSRELNEEEQAKQMKFLLKQMRINRREEFFESLFSYEYIKESTAWLLDTASCDFSLTFEDLTLIMTIYVLFADDIKNLCAPSTMDDSFAVSYAVCLFTFIFELLASSWSKTDFFQWSPYPMWEGYFLSFFWWLDVVAILSLFPDIPFVGKPLGVFGLGSEAQTGGNFARSGRVVRLVRLVRLVRVYKVASERRERQQNEEELQELVRIGAIAREDVEKQAGLYSHRQSRLGDRLSESTTRRVIIMILLMIIILPILTYSAPNEGPQFAMRMMHNFNVDSNVSAQSKEAVMNQFVQSFTSLYDDRYVGMLSVVPSSPTDPYVYYHAYIKNLRFNTRMDEVLQTVVGSTTYTTSAIFALVIIVREQAQMFILMTFFVAFMLIGASLVFTNDAQRLVIAPIERMMNMVEGVAADPLKPLHFHHASGPTQTGEYEMRLLETTIEKITGLLRVGFGEAGAGIISANLSTKDSSAAINPLLPGVRIYAIFGFCDIHHFEDINRKLSNDVLMFVNSIAEIVHSNVHAWSGQCNKNLGNAFVIVWRIGDEHSILASQQNTRLRGNGGGGNGGGGSSVSEKRKPGTSERRPAPSFTGTSRKIKRMNSNVSIRSTGSDDKDSQEGGMEGKSGKKQRKQAVIDLRRVPGVDILASHALIGYCKIIAEINRNKYVLRYRNEPRLTEKGKHDFKVRMGFGLHAGWAIEGAVGSLQKVDATYLSPHVNMAARLETSSKQYGVPLLASQDFYDLLSPEGQVVMRRLDVVTVKGSEVPIGIYTYDALQEQVFLENKKDQRPSLNAFVDDAVPPMNGTPSARHSRIFPGASTPAGTEGGSGTNTPARRPSISLLPGDRATTKFLTADDHVADVYEQDYDLLTLRKHATDPEFLNIFKEGVALYLAGDWKGAKVLLAKSDLYMRECVPELGGDGPSQTLLNYMENQNFEPPKSWQGFRPLTAK